MPSLSRCGPTVGEALLDTAGLPLHVAGYLRRDTWNGRNRRELVIEDVADPRRQKPGPSRRPRRNRPRRQRVGSIRSAQPAFAGDGTARRKAEERQG